jgi:hypothetical protein
MVGSAHRTTQPFATSRALVTPIAAHCRETYCYWCVGTGGGARARQAHFRRARGSGVSSPPRPHHHRRTLTLTASFPNNFPTCAFTLSAALISTHTLDLFACVHLRSGLHLALAVQGAPIMWLCLEWDGMCWTRNILPPDPHLPASPATALPPSSPALDSHMILIDCLFHVRTPFTAARAGAWCGGSRGSHSFKGTLPADPCKRYEAP